MDLCEVRNYHGTPTLHINGKPCFAPMLTTNKNQRYDGVWTPDPWAKDFGKAGFRLFQVELSNCSFDMTYDAATDSFPAARFEALEVIREYAKRIPGCKLLLRVLTEPRGDDSAWIKRHPEQCEVMEEKGRPRRVVRPDGTVEMREPYATPSYSSGLWLRDACRYLTSLCENIIARGLEDSVLGILIGGGDSMEWVKVGPMEDWAGDYSAPSQEGFQRWLKQKYVTDEALRAAWGDDDATLDDPAPVPSPCAQGQTALYLFRDPVRGRPAIDYFDYLAGQVAQDICTLGAAVKKASDRHWLAGVFYGYIQEMVWDNGFFGQGAPDSDCEHSAAARSGHAGLSQVLACPDIDFLSSPYSYGCRGVGGEGGFMSPYQSVRDAGKLWYSEEDTRTPNWSYDNGYGQARDVPELIELLKRQFSNILIHQSAAWWCDWAKDSATGSYDFPEAMALFRRLVQLGEHAVTLPDRQSAAEVAVVIDARSSFYRSTRNNLDIPIWRSRAWAISRMGTPVDYVLLSDVLSGRAKKYKMYYMLNVFHLSEEEREGLRAIVEKDGVVTLWMYAPGFSDETSLDTAHIEALTGMKVRMRPRQWSVNIFASNFDDPIMRDLPTGTFWGTDMQLGPIFSIDTEGTDAVALGTSVSQQGRFETGFAVSRRDGYTCAYSVAPMVPAGVLRGLAREAGAHIWTEEEDVIYAGHDMLMLHTVRTGDKTVSLPRAADVYDAFTGHCVARGASTFTDRLEAGHTRLYYFGDSPLPDVNN